MAEYDHPSFLYVHPLEWQLWLVALMLDALQSSYLLTQPACPSPSSMTMPQAGLMGPDHQVRERFLVTVLSCHRPRLMRQYCCRPAGSKEVLFHKLSRIFRSVQLLWRSPGRHGSGCVSKGHWCDQGGVGTTLSVMMTMEQGWRLKRSILGSSYPTKSCRCREADCVHNGKPRVSRTQHPSCRLACP